MALAICTCWAFSGQLKKGCFGSSTVERPCYTRSTSMRAWLLRCCSAARNPRLCRPRLQRCGRSSRQHWRTCYCHCDMRWIARLPAGSIPSRSGSPIWPQISSPLRQVWGATHAPLTRSRVKFLTHSRAYAYQPGQYSELGYSPTVGLEEGMKRTATWYHKHYHIDD